MSIKKSIFISLTTCLFSTVQLHAQAGNVGIGTTSPTAGLEIITAGNTLNALRLGSNQAFDNTPDVGIISRYKYNAAGAYTIGSVINTVKDNTTDGNESGHLRFQTNNAGTLAERMRITSGGNVGIGTTSITSGTRLEVAGNISIKSGADAYVQTTDANNLILRADQQAGASGKGLRFQYWNAAGWQNALYFDNVTSGYNNLIMQSAGGNVGIGTTSPYTTLSIGSTDATAQISPGGSNTHLTLRSVGAGGAIRFYTIGGSTNNTATTESMGIYPGGNVGIGTTSPTDPLHVIGNVRATSYNSSSDARLKNVLQNWASDDHIDFVQFRWKNGTDDREHYGYLAQEVQKVLPDAIHTDSEGMMAVNYDEVHSFKISNLERKNSEQEKRIKELEQSVEELKKMIKRKKVRR